MSSGVFAVARNLFEHEAFEDEPFTEREAWIWLIREAAWKERQVRVGRDAVKLMRGQCTGSVRFMADRWKWSKSRVDRFLRRLAGEGMVKIEAGQQRDSSGTTVLKVQNVITICNYDDYQRVSLPDTILESQEPGQGAGQQRDTSGTNKNTGSNNLENIPLRGPVAVGEKSAEAELFRFGKSVLGKNAGGVIVNLRKACEYDDAYALELLQQAAEKHEPMAWVQAAIKSVKDRPYRNVAGVKTGPVAIESREDRAYREWEDRYYATVL